MENRHRLLFGIIGIWILLFLLSVKYELRETEGVADTCSYLTKAESSLDNGQEINNRNFVYLCPLRKKTVSVKDMEKIVRLMAVTLVFANLFHMNGVLFLQGKGRVFVCFKSCVFYPAHFLCELFIRQKSDGKKRVCLS